MNVEVDTTNKNGIKGAFNTHPRPIVSIDVEKYKSLIDDPTLSDAEKESFLQALWSIIVAFVDLGFGVHPLQEVCAQENEYSDDELKEAFDRAERTDSNDTNKMDGSPVGGLEME